MSETKSKRDWEPKKIDCKSVVVEMSKDPKDYEISIPLEKNSIEMGKRKGEETSKELN